MFVVHSLRRLYFATAEVRFMFSSSFRKLGLDFNLEQDCLLQGQAQLDQRVVFCFCTLRLRGGGVRLQK